MASQEWLQAREDLAGALASLGFEKELGYEMARHLGSPQAMQRMRGYLLHARPASVEMVVDEMLAICEEINAWKRKKNSRLSQAAYNEMLFDKHQRR